MTKCPVCKTVDLQYTEEDLGLRCYSCSSCGGDWVRFEDYLSWKNRSSLEEAAFDPTHDYVPEYDSKMANLCPDCGKILIKYNVLPGLSFRVDHCGSCNGVWLDKNEWEALIKNDSHQQLNDFFTAPWQQKLKREMTRQRFEEHYIKKFGKDDYDKLKDIREWVRNSSFRDEAIAFLIDEDPFLL